MPQKKYKDIVVHTFTNSLYDMNSYVVQKNNDCLIIDCGNDYHKMINLIKKEKLNVLCILITHGHIDHTIGAHDLQVEYKCDIYIHKKEQWYLSSKYAQYAKRYFKIDDFKTAITKPMPEVLKIGNFTINTFFNPGHSLASNSFYFQEINVLFSGDFIFRDTIGRTDLPDSNPQLMQESLKRFVQTFDVKMAIYPGHGYSTTMANELQNNNYVKDVLKQLDNM